MNSKYKIEKISIKGFRGYPVEKTFNFDGKSLISITGPNKSGKSSLVNSIEWCLYGDNIAQESNTGIRERINWDIQTHGENETRVEITALDEEKNRLTILRKKEGSDETFKVNAEEIDSDDFIEEIGIPIEDFFSSIHLHQEIIRKFLVAPASERKQVIYRLLKLSNMLTISGLVSPLGIARKLEDSRADFNIELEEKLRHWEEEIESKKKECEELSESYFSENGIKKLCEKIRNKLQSSAQNVEIELPDLGDIDSSDKRIEFRKNSKEFISKLRSEHPSRKQWEEVIDILNKLEIKKNKVKNTKEETNKIKEEIDEIKSEYGEKEDIEEKLLELEGIISDKKDERSQKKSEAGVIDEAIKYLKDVEQIKECPVCGSSKSKKQIMDYLEIKYENIKNEIEPIIEKINDLEEERKKIKEAESILAEKNKGLKAHYGTLSDLKQDIEDIIGEKISEETDLHLKLEEEISKREEQRDKLKPQVEEINKKLDKLRDKLGYISNIEEILRLKSEIKRISQIEEHPKWEELEEIINDALVLDKDLEAIEKAIDNGIQKRAEERLDEVGEEISTIFKQITERPLYSNLKLSPDKFEPIAYSESKEHRAIRFLNQGDLNAAALAIFLALAREESSHKLGFIILDDPSQSLDSKYKKRLAKIIQETSEKGNLQIIMSTMDEEMTKDIENVSLKKRLFVLSNWSPEDGPEIEVR